MKLAFLGAGKMATAICRGLIVKQVFKANEIVASDVSAEARARFSDITGIACYDNNMDILQASETAVLALKPQVAHDALNSLRGLFENKLLISIAAGLSISKLCDWIGSERVIRVMPNTPVTISMGASAYACSSTVSACDKKLVKTIFESVGIAVETDEKKLDAVTGLSGSGPAYVFEFIQAMLDGAISVGLNPTVSLDLVLQTIIGAAQMIQLNMGSPDELRDAVTSPGGTTQAGLEVLKAGNFRHLIVNVIQEATRRSIELGRE